MLKENILTQALVAAKAAGLAINPVAAGILLGATISVMMITKSAHLGEKAQKNDWDWWNLVPISGDAMPDK